MKLSEYIRHLQQLLEDHGDLLVTTYGWRGVHEVNAPEVKHMLILKGRESKRRYWAYEQPDRKGDLVISI